MDWLIARLPDWSAEDIELLNKTCGTNYKPINTELMHFPYLIDVFNKHKNIALTSEYVGFTLDLLEHMGGKIKEE